MPLKPLPGGKRMAVMGNRQRQEMVLDVGVKDARAAANMATAFETPGGTVAPMGRQPLHSQSGLP